MADKLSRWRRQDILIDAPLYEEFDLREFGDEVLGNIDPSYLAARFALSGSELNAFCHNCGELSVFKLYATERSGVVLRLEAAMSRTYGQQEARGLTGYGIFTMTARCTREVDNYSGFCGATFYFCLFYSGHLIIKVGQYQHPSQAEVARWRA